MLLNDRWTVMNNSSSELDSKPPIRRQWCRRLLWCLLFVSVLAAVSAATLSLLHLHHIPLLSDRFSLGPGFTSKPGPGPGSKPDPGFTSKPGPGTSSRPLSPGSVGLGPGLDTVLLEKCPDLSQDLLRLEALHSSLLSALANQEAALREGRGPANQEAALREGRGLEHTDLTNHAAEQTEGRDLSLTNHNTGHTHHLRKEAEFLRKEAGLLKKEAESVQKETESLRRSQEQVLQALARVQTSATEPQQQTARPRDCRDLLKSGSTSDGVYSIYPQHDPQGFRVYCDMSTAGGGWTVIQRREDGSVNFFRGWDAYRDGFGRTTGEHWLGLQRISALTGSGGYELRIDMSDFENSTAFAQYSEFSVGLDSVNPEEDGFPLFVDGFSGTAGDSLLKHSGMRFTTRDRDLDQSENNCAGFYQGAWWYRNCHTSNLNGLYLGGPHASYADGVEWSSWTGWQYSLRTTEMKIRPRDQDQGSDRGLNLRLDQTPDSGLTPDPGLTQD